MLPKYDRAILVKLGPDVLLHSISVSVKRLDKVFWKNSRRYRIAMVLSWH